MGVKDGDYDVIYRGENRDAITPGRWVFIQRAKEYGGGYWLGRYFEDTCCFWLELEKPVSLNDGLVYLVALRRVEPFSNTFDDDFQLE
ncbi:TPA: hypothetical protein ACGB3K_005147 [Klebsiella aerogenes]|nr:hypothetical protein [Klebsiella aerogenes]